MFVAVLLLPGMRGFDYTAAMDVFGVDRTSLGVPLNVVRPVSTRRRVPLDNGLTVAATDLCDADSADLVVVPGVNDPSEPNEGREVARALSFLRAASGRGAQVASLCTGAFLAARAGLLDGSEATTHWHYADLLRRRHPRVKVLDNVLYTHDPRSRVWTSAGVTAGIDLSLALVSATHGESVSATVARCMVVPATRPGGQAQYVPARHRPQEKSGAEFEPLRDVLRADLARRWTLADISVAAACAPRTLQRRFTAETGLTPTQWLIRERVSLARELLENTTLTVAQIAVRTGFGGPDLLRKHFAAQVTVPPSRYREAFSR